MAMKTIYKTKESLKATIELYDMQLSKLDCDYKDIYINTSFGKTHLIEIGNFTGIPLLVFHGGNSTSAYNLLRYEFLLKDFHIYAVDIIGHPGKSAEVDLCPIGYDYGKWANEVIDILGFKKISCLGSSFGAGILAKLMCIEADKINKSVLLTPSGIKNSYPLCFSTMIIPVIKYIFTKNTKYLTEEVQMTILLKWIYNRTKGDKYTIETALFIAVMEDILDKDTLDAIKNSFDHVKLKIGMPSNASKKLIKKCNAQTLVIASEYDCLFPAKKILKRAKNIIPNCTVHELKGRGHMHLLTNQEKNMIIEFLK